MKHVFHIPPSKVGLLILRGQFDLKDDAKSGRPISVTNPDKMDAIRDMIISDRRISAK